MADDFGLKIGLEGEKEFKKALADINQSFKVLGSEMQLVASQFGKNEQSIDSLTAKNQVLERQIEAQKQKITTLRSALDNAAAFFGESDRRTQQWQIQLNKAEAALNDMERELSGIDRLSMNCLLPCQRRTAPRKDWRILLPKPGTRRKPAAENWISWAA